MKTDTKKLDQLTSLRFFAALMIVFHHANGLFGIGSSPVNLGVGVSFFFVLSGFILTYVYPKLETWPAVRRFWRARIARIWPAYLASLALWGLLVGSDWEPATALAHALMVQAWVPVSSFYFSYNAVAWSVSTELFFYLLFPALLLNWKATWHWKLLGAALVVLALVLICLKLQLPDYGDPAAGTDGMLVSTHGLLYISPVSRVFEFILGMCVAYAFRRKQDISWSTATGSALEFGALALAGASMLYMGHVVALVAASPLGAPASTWVLHSGSALFFALLIYFLAHGRGWLSKCLAHPALVVLGEISFSMYLIHQLFLTYYRNHLQAFPALADPLAFALFMLVLLLASYLMWTAIEMPGRRLLMGSGQRIHGSPAMERSWRQHLVVSPRTALAGTVLASLLGWFYYASGRVPTMSAESLATLTPAHLKQYSGVTFGKQFTLRGLEIECARDGLHLKLAWASAVAQRLSMTTAVHLVDDAGTIKGVADYRQPDNRNGVQAGQVWLDTRVIPKEQLVPGVSGLALGIYQTADAMLVADTGSTDWSGRRLRVRFGGCE